MIRTILALAMLMLASACAQLPKAELQAYRDAFQAGRSAADPLLESYTINERAAAVDALRRASNFAPNGFYGKFDAEHANLISSLSVPPGSEATRRAFDAIARYNDTLVSLAEDRNIDEAQAQIQQITNDLNAVTGNLAVLTGPLPSANILGTAAGELINLFTPLIQKDNREEFRRIVIQGHPHIVEMIGALRDLTDPQYDLITKPLRARWDAADGDPAAQAKIAEEINGWHSVFADYVVLLNVMEQRLGDLKQAVANPKNRSLLARATTGVGDVRAYSDILKRSIAQLRAPK